MKTPKNLTPAMKKFLEEMKAPEAHLSAWIHSLNTTFRPDGKSSTYTRSIRWEWMHFLKPFFIEKYADSYYTYTLREDAVISDEWLTAQVEQGKEAERQKKESEALAMEKAAVAASAWFNDGMSGPYRVEMSGDRYLSGAVFCGEDYLFSIQPTVSSTQFKGWQEALAEPRNRKQYEAVREMLRRANQMVEVEDDRALCKPLRVRDME